MSIASENTLDPSQAWAVDLQREMAMTRQLSVRAGTL